MTPTLFQSLYRCAMAAAIAAALSMVGSTAAHGSDDEAAYTEEACIECHQPGSEESDLHISVDVYQASVHAGETTCQDCHTEVVDDEHQSVEGSGRTDCSGCHEQENRHGVNGSDEVRPQCHDCHTRHNMLFKTDPASTVHADQLPITCAGCHPVACGEEDFFSWFPAFQIASHNKADFGAAYEKDNCLGCHQGAGVHGESEPINGQACYKCHFASDAAGAIWGRMHPQANMRTQPAVFAAASIYQVFIVIGLVLFTGRFIRRRRSSQGRRPDAAEETIGRNRQHRQDV